MCADKWEQERDARQKECEGVCDWARKLAAALGPHWSVREWRDSDTGRLTECAPCKIVHANGPTLTVDYDNRKRTVQVGVMWPRESSGRSYTSSGSTPGDRMEVGCKFPSSSDTVVKRILKWLPLYMQKWDEQVALILSAEQGRKECIEQAQALAALLPPAKVIQDGGSGSDEVSVHFKASEITRLTMRATYPPEEAKIRMDLYNLNMTQARAILAAIAEHAAVCGKFAVGEECDCTYCMSATSKGAPWNWHVTLVKGTAEATVSVCADTAKEARLMAIEWYNREGTCSEVRITKPWDSTPKKGDRMLIIEVKRGKMA